MPQHFASLFVPFAAYMQESFNRLNRATTLQTMWNSLTIPEQFAALGMLSVQSINQSKHISIAPYVATNQRRISVTHRMPALVLLSVVGVGMQQCMIRHHIFNIQHRTDSY